MTGPQGKKNRKSVATITIDFRIINIRSRHAYHLRCHYCPHCPHYQTFSDWASQWNCWHGQTQCRIQSCTFHFPSWLHLVKPIHHFLYKQKDLHYLLGNHLPGLLVHFLHRAYSIPRPERVDRSFCCTCCDLQLEVLLAVGRLRLGHLRWSFPILVVKIIKSWSS